MCAGKGKGHYGVAEAYVDEELIPKINWKRVLKSRLTKVKTQDKSLATPNRRFVHTGLYISGYRRDEAKLKDVKIAIDTSGSMTDTDIAIAFGQIRQLLKEFDMEAEIIFWDDGIQDTCDFNDYNTLKLAQCRAMGRGGTDPNCVFEHFNSGDYLKRKKPRPEIIIIFTDGYFSGPSEKYAKKYGRDTLWVISRPDGGKSFNPPFGKVAKLKDA